MPVQIRNPEVVRAIRALAERTGRPMTEAVAMAVRSELSRQVSLEEAAVQKRLGAIRKAAAALRELPVIGPPLTDDDLYDGDGLPK